MPRLPNHGGSPKAAVVWFWGWGKNVACCFAGELAGGRGRSSVGDGALQSNVEVILERINLEPVSTNL